VFEAPETRGGRGGGISVSDIQGNEEIAYGWLESFMSLPSLCTGMSLGAAFKGTTSPLLSFTSGKKGTGDGAGDAVRGAVLAALSLV